MKVLIFSDTHGAIKPMQEIINQENDAKICFHLGDGVEKLIPLQAKNTAIKFYGVHGNCDSYGPPRELILPLKGQLLLLTHGDCFRVKEGLSLFWEHARQHNVDIALFGHTHRPFYELKNGIHLFNPGSLTKPHYGQQASYGLLHLKKNEMPQFEIKWLK